MKKTHVLLHHSATADSGTVSWGAIRRYHVETNGWAEIGYNLGCELVGDHYEMMLGRDFDAKGAHCYQAEMNVKALGVCFVGDFDKAAPANEMLVFAARKLRPIMASLGIPANRAHVLRHSDYAPKTCPGILFPYAAFLGLLQTPGD
jgi:N-acetylmuramoyl-L-alanine amidase